MVRLNQENIEEFIRENKDKFNVYIPPVSHMDRILFKLNNRIKHIINIVPYLFRVAIATALIFTSSIIIWNNFIRKDRHEITLKHKILIVSSNIRAIIK